ncbi:hypothetical protein FA95DRAFT_1505424 [Auriscalpium vulgare]|uniref:Uncharacterized protein n=1 Tax=Auriscalpium vulgare TaxID=40419 RepID=A0ACB8R3V6_9AGAM|nr:hypothetical protein FA95DRAFT_1505424 [Auriscalpium vulgare]
MTHCLLDWDGSDEDGGYVHELETQAPPKRKQKATGNAQQSRIPQVQRVLYYAIVTCPNTVRMQITISSPVAVTSRLPARRKNPKSTLPSPPPTSSPTPSSPTRPSTPVRRSNASSSNKDVPFTPYDSTLADGKRQSKQSPATKGLLDVANVHMRIKVANEEAFPDESGTTQMAMASFIEACQEASAPRRRQRFDKDKLYRATVISIVAQRTWNLRGQVKTKAQQLVPTHYGLLKAKNTPANVEDRVNKLLKKGQFHFRDIEKRRGPFGNAIIPALIAAQWLANSTSDAAGLYSGQFNPVSVQLIALVVTSIECGLVDWKTGSRVTKGNEFSYDAYRPVYVRHLESLEKFKKKEPAALASLQRKIYDEAL